MNTQQKTFITPGAHVETPDGRGKVLDQMYSPRTMMFRLLVKLERGRMCCYDINELSLCKEN